MNRTLIIVAILIGNLSLRSQYLWQIYPDTILKWNYYNGDEFNQNVIDETKWIRNLPWSRAVLSQDIYYLDSNVRVNNSNIQFLLNKESNFFPLQNWEMDTVYLKENKITLSDGNKFPFKYTGGLIWSKRQYKYGYFEIKFKAPVGQGIWPAFWLYGGNPNNEIDFLELKGEKNRSIHVDIHCKDGCSNYTTGWFGYRKAWGHWVNVKEKLNENYNIISGEWTPDYIKWFLNGELIAYSKHSIDMAMSLTAGTGIAKDGGAFKPGPNLKTPFPNVFDVDYIRIYKTDTLPNYLEIKKALVEKVDTLNEKNTHLLNSANRTLKFKHGDSKKAGSDKSLITLSVMQLTKNTISVRVLGVSKNDTVFIIISDVNRNIIQKLSLYENTELSVPFNLCKELNIHAEINNHIIDEDILVQ